MTEPTDPNVTAARDANASAASNADETAPMASGKPKFGPPAAPGETGTLGPYRVLKQLGAGGMGAVYLAIDTRLDRKLALKVMLPEFAANREAKERFLREAKSAAKISHDNVVTVFEADERDGVPYIAMQFLQGYPLDEYLKNKGAPPLAHVIRIVREAALGLAAAHDLGLVHRDIKPGNLWLEAPNGRVKVLDFGLAKPVGSETELTSTGAVVGTPAYMSPEQARGVKIDARTDLFSLGALLYRLCTGRTPFHGPNVMAVLMALGSDDPPPVRELNPNVPEPLAALIHQLLAKKPELRPQTAAEVTKRLQGILAQALNPGGAPAVVAPSTGELSVSQPVVVHALPLQPPNVIPMHVTAVGENAFAGLGDDPDDEGAQIEAEPAAPRRESKPRVAKTGGKGVLIGAGVAALLAVGVVAVVVSQMGKKGDPTAEKGPDAPTPGDTPRPKPKPPTKGGEAFALPPKPWVPPAAVPVGQSPFDKLDAKEVPAAERFDGQPKELVAVVGTHARRTWSRLADGATLAVSPDGALVAAGGQHTPLRVWDVKTRALKADLPGYLGYAIAFAADGRSIHAPPGPAGEPFLRWDLTAAPGPPAPWDGGPVYRDYVLGLWISPDSARAVVSQHTKVYAWDLTAKPAKEVLRFDNATRGVASADGRRVAFFQTSDRRFVVTDVAPRLKEVWRSEAGADDSALALAPDGKRFAFNANGRVRVLDLTASPPAVVEFGPGVSVTGDGFSPDGKRFVTLDSNRHLQLWDVTGPAPKEMWAKPLALPGQGASQYIRLAFAGDGGNTLIAFTGLGFVHFFDVSGTEPKLLDPLDPDEPAAPTLAVDGLSGRVALDRASNGQARWWDFGRPKPAPTDVLAPSATVAATPDGGKHAVWSAQQIVTIHADGKPAGTLPGMEAYGAFTADGRTYWGLTPNGAALKGWDVSGAEPRELHTVTVPAIGPGNPHPRVSLHRNETVLACHYGKLTLWDLTVTPPRLLSTFPGPTDWRTVVFPDGEKVLTYADFVPQLWRATAKGWEKVWEDAAAGSNKGGIFPFHGADGAPRHVAPAAPHPSGHLFALSQDHAITIRRSDTGAVVHTIPTKTMPWNLAFAPDGRHLFVVNGFNTVYVLRLPDLSGAADRAAAEWALSVGGFVSIADGAGEREIREAKALPAGPFRVWYVNVLGGGDKVTDADLARVKGLTHLRWLHFGRTKVTDAGLAHLADLTTLTSVEWLSTDITGAGLVHLAGNRDLDSAQFAGTPLTDAGLAHLKGATKMAHMNLSGTKLTDASAAVFETFPQLNHLNLGVVEAVTDATLERLHKSSNLRILFLKGTKVTADGVAKLAKALPNCTIDWDGGKIEPKK